MSKVIYLLILGGVILSCPIGLMGRTLHVPAEFPTIQSGIDSAAIGDTVVVSSGTYEEHLTINKKIVLMGEAVDGPQISGSDIGDVILVSANGVIIKNLSISHSGSSNNGYSPCDAGIKLEEVDSCFIQSCRISNNGAAGIVLVVSSFNRVENCLIYENQFGFYFCEDVPLTKFNNIGNEIIHNRISLNQSTGILFAHMVDYHWANLIYGNIIDHNGTGISAIVFDSNAVVHNVFLHNTGYAISKYICMGGGDNNSFYLNAFIDNNNGAIQAQDEWDVFPPNYWYSQSLGKGNYWSDYTGVDGNGDGLGDTPYPIDRGYAYDIYPLMQLSPYDIDGDSISDSADNCPLAANLSQADADMDHVGDACDECTDSDGDGYGNPGYPANTCPDDNCPSVSNTDQLDSDNDGIGRACDFECGDIDHDETISLADITYFINYLYSAGPAPVRINTADVNGNCLINIQDITDLIKFLYLEGAPLNCPATEPCQ